MAVAALAIAGAGAAVVIAKDASKEDKGSLDEIARLRVDLARLNSKIESINTAATAATKNASELSKPIADTNANLNKLKKRVTRTEDDIATLQNDFTGLSKRVARLEDQNQKSSSGGK
jgi:peptidoglycan hydrolase CwlO-like protein